MLETRCNACMPGGLQNRDDAENQQTASTLDVAIDDAEAVTTQTTDRQQVITHNRYAHSVEFSHVIQGCSQEFHLGDLVLGRTNEWPKATSGGWENFWNFCFEMVHFCAELNNAVHRHWFSGSGCYSEKTDSRLIKFVVIISGGGGGWTCKTTPNYGPG